jgi:REP element-mobilizing transposase RayT
MNRMDEYRRHLPHYQSDHKAIFLTFSSHHRWILHPDARTIVLECCVFEDGSRVNLHGAVVMPDRVHLVLTPRYDGDSFFGVSEIMQGVKSASAHKIK